MLLNGQVPGLCCQASSDSSHGHRVMNRGSQLVPNLSPPARQISLGSNQINPTLTCRYCRDIAGHCRLTPDDAKYYCYFYFHYYYYYNYYYYYCYYYYCRDPMSSTQNPTTLYGVQEI